jgi:hypothetical protein
MAGQQRLLTVRWIRKQDVSTSQQQAIIPENSTHQTGIWPLAL